MSRQEVEALLKENPGRFYVYQLARPDGTPFYIGKGVGRRVFQHETEAKGPGWSHKLNTIRLLDRGGFAIHYSILAFFDCENECHAREVLEIRRIGRFDLKTGPLTNLTDGGEGAVGLSEETRERIDFNLHSADAPGERGIANRFYFELCSDVRSVPVRPLGQISKPRALGVPVRTDKGPSRRQVAALAASAIANRVLLEPGAILPRRLQVDGSPLIMEFGVCRNILESGLAELAGGRAGYEHLLLTVRGYAAICSLLDTRVLISAGVMVPDANG
jgi:hypothetical protein